MGKLLLNNKLFLILIIILIVLKVFFIYLSRDVVGWSKDENANYAIASNYIKGLGYTVFDHDTNSYKKTSFHASFPVFTYILLQRAGISKGGWLLFIHSLSVILYGLSLVYFYRILRIFSVAKPMCLVGTLLYGAYPSVLYYIGSLFLYENIALPFLIIVIYQLLKYYLGHSAKWQGIFIISIIVAISCLYRPQMLFVYFIVFTIFSIISIINYRNDKKRLTNISSLLITVGIVVILSHLPLLIKNKVLFGNYILSTQPGFELLQGHNPYARGSVDNNWYMPGNNLYKYYRRAAGTPDVDSLNEYEESLERQRLAIKWILQNPAGETRLALKKIAIYFLPQNYDALPYNRIYNPINLTVHLLFLIVLALGLVRFRTIGVSKEDILILSPVIASILLSLIFFVGYRWRYYAEPFMIAYIFIFLGKLKHGQSKIAVSTTRPSE